MFRTASFLVLMTGYLCLTAYREKDPRLSDRPFPVNSKVANFFLTSGRPAPGALAPQETIEADTVIQARVLMLNYGSFDADYANMVRRTLQRQMPLVTLTDFWDGSPEDLSAYLSNQDAVIIAYPSGGDSSTLKGYARVLTQFIRQGGGVVFTGTHEYAALQQYGLFDIDSGYFCDNMEIHSDNAQHPVLAGVGDAFTLNNFAYPLDVSDPGFVTLASIRGYPVMGYKSIGAGKVVYLGLEYFYDEAKTTRILSNTIGWLAPAKTAPATPVADKTTDKRVVEFLYAGNTSKQDAPDLKVYPNPYVSKANVELELTKNTMVSLDVTDETGRSTALLLPRKNLVPGLYRFDLPGNLAPGVYFIRCQAGDKVTVKRVVKSSAP
jgi:hypothetical protein